MKSIIAASVIVLMAGAGAVRADQAVGVVDATKQAGEATKDAAKTAGETTEKAAKKTAKSTKKAVTGKVSAHCSDGTHQTGKTAAAAEAACSKHGGVAR
jgi:hypothetical protein